VTPARISWNPKDTDAIFPPGWIPCDRCNYPLKAHVDTKCPFDSVNFAPLDALEIWKTLDEASKYVTNVRQTSFMDLTPENQVRYYKEARKSRLLQQLKEKSR
jgi:hypothetical protein